MPLIYHSLYSPQNEARTRRSPASQAPTTAQPQPTDADDSIVLSDLVRSGEASRLRRRGAMRLDHARRASNPPQVERREQQQRESVEQRPPYIVINPSPTWSGPSDGTDSDEDTATESFRREWGPPAMDVTEERLERCEEESVEAQVYTLYCGGDDGWSFEDAPGASTMHHYEPSPLPSYSSSEFSSSCASKSEPVRKTSGCGAVVHRHALPRQRVGVWTANAEAEKTVVPLDSSYFDRGVRSMMMNSSCGCVREGIGCAECGNTLGTRYKPCQAAAEGLFSSTGASSSAHPDGPSYWTGRPARSSSSRPTSRKPSTMYMYTFFSSSVTSSPNYNFPRGRRPGRVEPPSIRTSLSPPPADAEEPAVEEDWILPSRGVPYSSGPQIHVRPARALRPDSPISITLPTVFTSSATTLQSPSTSTLGQPDENSVPFPSTMNGDGNEDREEEFDPDGVLIAEDPSSPADKTNGETALSGR